MAMQATLRALSDPVRREILNLLKSGRLSAGEIGEHFAISGAAISKHLAVLKEADLVRDERQGKFIYYALNATVLEEILLWLKDLKGADNHAEKEYRGNDPFLFGDPAAHWCRTAAVGSAAGAAALPLECRR